MVYSAVSFVWLVSNQAFGTVESKLQHFRV